MPISGAVNGLYKDSIVLLEQVRTIDYVRLRDYMGLLDRADMEVVDSALEISFGLEFQTIMITGG